MCQILEVPVVEHHPARIKEERSVVIVVVCTFQSNVLPMAKNVSNARRRIISQNFVGVQIKSQVVGSATLNILQGKKFMKWKKWSLNTTLILWNLNKSGFQNLCLTPEKISPHSQNIMFDEMSESKKLYHALINVCWENWVGISLQVRFKLDTGASANLLPVSVYYELFPDCNMKDLGKTIDKSIQLLQQLNHLSNSLALYVSEFITPIVISHTLVYFL